VEVINNLDAPLKNSHAHLSIYNLDGSVMYQRDFDVSAAPSLATSLGAVDWPAGLSAVHFVKLELREADGKPVSENFYWRALPEHQDDLKALSSLPTVTLDAKVAMREVEGRSFFDVTLHNPGTQIALMAHVQLRRKESGERVLPVYCSDNYVSLVPNESRTITIEAATSDLKREVALVLVDGWNVGVAASSVSEVDIGLNVGAQVDHWPMTGLPMMSDVK
jgi:beta-mannosidase